MKSEFDQTQWERETQKELAENKQETYVFDSFNATCEKNIYSAGQKFSVTFESLELVNNSAIQNIDTCEKRLCSSHIFTLSRHGTFS